MNKKVESKYFNEQVTICREAGLITNTSLIIGYPQETKETIKETMTKLAKLKVYPSTGFLLPMPETGMWDHAIKNNYIKDIDKYLTEITERQDFSLNMTKMTDEELKNETLQWLTKLNEIFGNSLDESKLLKTGGEDQHSKHQEKSKNMPQDKNATTKDILNYAAQEGTMR